MGIKYQQPATLNVSLGQENKDWIISRAEDIASIKGISSNASAVVVEALECYQQVLDRFGENWEDKLKVQKRPVWVDDIIAKLDNLRIVSTSEQAEIIADIQSTMDVGDMLE